NEPPQPAATNGATTKAVATRDRTSESRGLVICPSSARAGAWVKALRPGSGHRSLATDLGAQYSPGFEVRSVPAARVPGRDASPPPDRHQHRSATMHLRTPLNLFLLSSVFVIATAAGCAGVKAGATVTGTAGTGGNVPPPINGLTALTVSPPTSTL